MEIFLAIAAVFAAVLFLFARESFFVALAGALVFGIIGGIAAYLLDAEPGLGLIVGGGIGGFVGMLASQHSGVTIGKLGRKSTISVPWLLTMVSYPGYALNLIQFFFQCPWRAWLKRYDSPFSRFARCGFGKFILGIAKAGFYVLSFPLRFATAFYYNIFVRLLSSFIDIVLEVLIPKTEGMRHKPFFIYLLLWVVKLPWRIVKFMGWKLLLTLVESVFFTVYDTIVPTLTMYHGTSKEAGALITSAGEWKVGGGDFAGRGIYFAIRKRTADHYQRLNSDGVIIVSRVSLGRTLNLSCTPSHIRNLVARDGDGISEYGLKHGYRTTEWWRTDGGWWEYCLMDEGGSYNHPWHIRELYVYYADSGVKKRIYGSMASWFFR